MSQGGGSVHLVELNKNSSVGLGFSILGGAGSNLPPIVYDILDGSPAGESGEVQAGDIILEVNGEQVCDLTTKEVLKCLRLAKGSVLLTLKRDAVVSARVEEYLHSANTLDSLRSAITERDLVHVRHVIAMKSSSSALSCTNSSALPSTRHASPVIHSVPVAHSPPSAGTRRCRVSPPTTDTSSNLPDPAAGGGGGVSSNGTAERPRYEAFTMTGDVMLSLSRRPLNPAALPCAPPQQQHTSSSVSESRRNKQEACVNGHASTVPAPAEQINGGQTSGLVNGLTHAAMEIPAENDPERTAAEDDNQKSSSSDTSEPQLSSVDVQPSASDSATSPNTSNVTESNDCNVEPTEQQLQQQQPHQDIAEPETDLPSPDTTDNVDAQERTDINNHIINSSSDEQGDLNKQQQKEEKSTAPSQQAEDESDVCTLPLPGGGDNGGVVGGAVAGVDVPSAVRLARRLFELDGFKKTDVCQQLCKNSAYNQTVAEEYVKLLNLHDLTLDTALRQFLQRLLLQGDTQQQERVLQHFSSRYLHDNPQAFLSSDACHTLTCALVLLDADLHSSAGSSHHHRSRMTCAQFITNLAALNEGGGDFDRSTLKTLYNAIKRQPLQTPHTAGDEGSVAIHNTTRSTTSTSSKASQLLNASNPFLSAPDPSTAVEYKRGYVMRKCCVLTNGKRAGVGKRSWRMFYCTLRDTVLYMHRDETASRSPTAYQQLADAIRLHHALACKATNYFKKEHVFRLQTADQAEYLLQTSDERELSAWIDTVNFVAASLSAAPLAAAVGSTSTLSGAGSDGASTISGRKMSGVKFQRPILPVARTQLDLREQYEELVRHVAQLESEVAEMNASPPSDKHRRSAVTAYNDRYTHTQYELERYRSYVCVMAAHVSPITPVLPASRPPHAVTDSDRGGHIINGAITEK